LRNIGPAFILAVCLALLAGLIGPAAPIPSVCAAADAVDPCKPENPVVPSPGKYQGTFKIQMSSQGMRELELIKQNEAINGTLLINLNEDFSVVGDISGDYTGTMSEKSSRIDYNTQRQGKIFGHLDGYGSVGGQFKAQDAPWGIDTTDNLGYSSASDGVFSGVFAVLEATCTTIKGVILKDSLTNLEGGMFNAMLLPSESWTEMVWQAQMPGKEPGLEQEVDQMIASSLALVPHRNLIANLLKKAKELQLDSSLQEGAAKCLVQKLINAARTIANNRLTAALQGGTILELLQLARDYQLMGYQKNCDLVQQALARVLVLVKASLKEAIRTGDIRTILQDMRYMAFFSGNGDPAALQEAWTAIENDISLTMKEAEKTGDMGLVVQMTQEAKALGFIDLSQQGLDWLIQHGYKGKK
jgi:hypothetical protein